MNLDDPSRMLNLVLVRLHDFHAPHGEHEDSGPHALK